MPTLVLVSCSGPKREPRGTYPARDQYTSELFEKSRAWAERHGDAWAILSGQFGLVWPDQPIPYYELDLTKQPLVYRKAWAAKVAEQLRPVAPQFDRIILLAGREYARFIPLLGVPVETPMARYQIGERKQWLNRELGLGGVEGDAALGLDSYQPGLEAQGYEEIEDFHHSRSRNHRHPHHDYEALVAQGRWSELATLLYTDGWELADGDEIEHAHLITTPDDILGTWSELWVKFRKPRLEAYPEQPEVIHLAVFGDNDAIVPVKKRGRASSSAEGTVCTRQQGEYQFLNVELCVTRHKPRGALPQILGGAEVARFLRTVYPQEIGGTQEVIGVLMMDNRGKPLASSIVSRGGEAQAMLDQKILLRTVLYVPGATRFVIWHNHPSEDPRPSADDEYLTQHTRQAAETVGIRLDDHIIIGAGASGGYYSFAEAGKMRR